MNTTITTCATKAKQFFNLLQGYTKGIRLTAILILLLMGVSNAWAGDPYISGFGLQFRDDGGDWFKTGTKGGDGIMDLDLGSKTNLKIVYIYANGNKNGGNLCDNSYFKYAISGTTQTENWGGTRHSDVDWTTPTYKWGTEDSQNAFIDLVQNRKPGNYSMEFIFSVEGNSHSSYCGNWYDCKYSNGNWKFTWSIPEPTITITGANALVVGTSTNIKASMSNYPIGSTISKIQVSGNTTSKSATGSTDNLTVSSVTPNASGKNGITVTVTVKFGTGGTKDYTYTYDVTPPAVNNFKVTASNVVSGTGTSGDPYIIPSGQSLTLDLSGSKAYTDVNSSLQYNTSGTWDTTTSRTISNITSTATKSVTVKMRCHNSSANLSGTESSKTIYYKAAPTYTVDLDQTGATTEGTKQVTVTYGSAMPSATMPTREGYTFGGYWTEKEGKGIQYYNANGTSARNWDQASNDILYAHWEEAQYTVTFGVHSTGKGQILFENTSTVINGSGSTTSQQKHGASISFTATPFAGYEVEGWYSNAACTQRIEAAGTHTRYNPAPVTSNVTIYVKFKEETRRIYLKPAGDNKWADGNARFAMYVINDQTWYSMTKINDGDDDTGNDIYYCDIKPTYQNVIFCRMNPDNLTNDWGNKWTQTIDLTLEDDCNLFDIDAEDKGQEYPNINTGKWMEYNAWQLVGSFSSWDPCGNRFDENSDGTYTYTIELTEGDYEFKLVRNGIWYGNNGNMERTGTGVQQGGWSMHDDAGDCTLKADMTGNYIFTIHENGKLTVTYPVTGYQLKITMNSGKVYTSNSVGNAGEILSFFAPGKDEAGDKAGTVKLCFEGEPIQNGTIAKETFATSNVYVAKLNANKNGITDIALYDGNYYIRTDGAAGGWNNYKQSSNKMTYFVPREEEKYSYYWVKDVRHSDDNNRVNVKACVANQYNNDLAGMLENDKFTDVNGDVFIVDPTVNGNLHRERVNLRFGYNPKTNFFERAMLTGSGNTNTFLNITAPDYVYLDNDQTVKLTTADKNSKFTDVSNWVYQKDIWVKPPTTGASVYLTAEAYNEEVNSLFGFDENGTPIARKIIGTNSGELRKMRTIYDFKTNRMIIAWAPDAQDITTEQILEADVLFIRHENEEVPQLTFKPEVGQIQGIQSQFFALELENARDKNAEEHYWISLPFDCVVGSISGVPGYMEIWGIQRYNGEERAQKGWFKETSTFWEWLEPDDVMNAGEGYVLSFDKNAATWNDFDVHDDDGKLIGTESLLRLYFPSTTKGFEFKNSQPEREYVNQPCTITRDNRHLQDGNWKIIGPMSYNTVTATPKYGAGDDVWKPEQDGDHVDVPEGAYKWSAPMFRYKYWEDESGNNWKYITEDGTTTYNSFFGYMVQFAGFIQWNSVSVSEPVLAGLTARRNTDTNERTNITMRLEIVNAEGKQQDQTFVALDVEATTTFDQNKDLNKIFNDGETNIYSLSEGIPFAGNALPMEESVVPVGVQIATEGEYTFRMPDGTEGMVVELVDYETNTRTNLLLSDYIVTLPKGTSENRFALHIQPQKDVVTSLENIGEGVNNGEAVNKYLIDGKLIIRTAEGIFDAQGKRL